NHRRTTQPARTATSSSGGWAAEGTTPSQRIPRGPFMLQEPAQASDLRCRSYSSNGDSADELEPVAGENCEPRSKRAHLLLRSVARRRCRVSKSRQTHAMGQDRMPVPVSTRTHTCRYVRVGSALPVMCDARLWVSVERGCSRLAPGSPAVRCADSMSFRGDRVESPDPRHTLELVFASVLELDAPLLRAEPMSDA